MITREIRPAPQVTGVPTPDHLAGACQGHVSARLS